MIRKIVRLVEESDKNQKAAFTQFLGPPDYSRAIEFIRKSSVYFELWGGYPYARRRMLGVHAGKDPTGKAGSNFLRDGTISPTLEFPASALRIRLDRSGVHLSPKRLIQVLRELDVPRRAVGDLIALEDSCVVFACSRTADEIRNQLLSFDEIQLLSEILGRSEFQEYEPELSTFTMAGNRIDAAVAGAFRISREDARDAVRFGRVLKNYKPISKVTVSIGHSDVIELKSRGRVRVVEITETAKGRLRVSLSRYPLPVWE